jgi:hypothetical protein
MRRSEAIAQHAEDAGALFKRPIRRSFAYLLPRIGAQNAIPRWIIPDSQGPARWLLSGLLAARPFCFWVESGPE